MKIQILCDNCNQTMKFIKDLQSKSKFQMKRYHCDICDIDKTVSGTGVYDEEIIPEVTVKKTENIYGEKNVDMVLETLETNAELKIEKKRIKSYDEKFVVYIHPESSCIGIMKAREYEQAKKQEPNLEVSRRFVKIEAAIMHAQNKAKEMNYNFNVRLNGE